MNQQEPQRDAASGQQTAGQTPGAERKPRLLVVDDEQAIIDFIKLGMRYEGFQVDQAGDGYIAIDMAQRLQPDAIILDVMLPTMDGLEACRRLRENEATANIPILMLTAKDEVRDRVTGLEA
ncbi:MAG: response regulator, partial [Ktedonobacterales bacterium]